MPLPSKSNREKLSSLLNEKKIQWKQVKAIINADASTTLESLHRQALHRACLDPSVCKSTMKALLQKTNVDFDQRIRYVCAAVRCHNMNAIDTLIHDDVAVLYWEVSGCGGNTLLHFVCEEHGWNEEVAYIFKETLENSVQDHDGMFHLNTVADTPLKLALEAGCDLEEIIYHLKEEYPTHFNDKLGFMPKVIAEYCSDVSLLKELIELYPRLLEATDKDGFAPLHYACFYQNEDMIKSLLEEYSSRGGEGRKLLLKKRLLALNKESMSPLGYLVLSLGDRDDGNAWRCMHTCFQFFDYTTATPILHVILDNMWDPMTRKKNCMRIIKQVVDRLHVHDFCTKDEDGRTLLSILIPKMASLCKKDKKRRALTMEFLEYILASGSDTNTTNWRNPATIRDGQHHRLPLHIACERALAWKGGLHTLVKANVVALDENDPVTNLPSFALAASNGKCDLDTIYRLLRFNPSAII